MTSFENKPNLNVSLNEDGTYSINNKKVEFDKFGEHNKELIPQLWWGNIENPEIIILAKNPHYGLSDIYENNNETI